MVVDAINFGGGIAGVCGALGAATWYTFIGGGVGATCTVIAVALFAVGYGLSWIDDYGGNRGIYFEAGFFTWWTWWWGWHKHYSLNWSYVWCN